MSRRKWNTKTIKEVLDGEMPFVQVGYTPKPKKRKLGDRWTDHHKILWEQKQGYVTRVNEQQDSIRESLKRICSSCGKNMDFSNDRLDEKIFPKTGKCFDCLTYDETVMKINGTYALYEKSKIMKNRLSALKDFRKNVIEAIEYLKKDDCKMSLVAANGDLTTWIGAQNDPILRDAEEDLKKATDEIARVENELLELHDKT
jgi:hypothetical protein